jgi:hypothetical protein
MEPSKTMEAVGRACTVAVMSPGCCACSDTQNVEPMTSLGLAYGIVGRPHASCPGTYLWPGLFCGSPGCLMCLLKMCTC